VGPRAALDVVTKNKTLLLPGETVRNMSGKECRKQATYLYCIYYICLFIIIIIIISLFSIIIIIMTIFSFGNC
jgi:hypothetical protein